MNCEESMNLMTVSVYGKLTPSEKTQLEAHLGECSRCASVYERLEKVSNLFNEKEDIPLPDKEKSWQIISAKAIRRKGGWLEQLSPRRPVFQFAVALLLLVVGFTAGYFIHSGWQMSGEMAELRQEVRQVRQIAAVSLIRQEFLNNRLRDAGIGPQLEQANEGTLGSLIRTFRGQPDLSLRQASIDDPYLFLRDPAVREDFVQSLSEQTSPLVEIALALARYIEQNPASLR